MNLFSRLWNYLRGRAHDAMDQIERPEDGIRHFVDNLNGQLEKLQKAVATAMADEKRLKMQADELLAQAKSWEEKAVWALQSDDEALAGEALVRKEECEKQAMVIGQSWMTQHQATQALRQNLATVRGQAEEAKRKANLMLAQYRSAEVKQKMAKTLDVSSGSVSAKVLEQLNEKILRLESEAQAQLDLGSSLGGEDLTERFKQLETRQRKDQALLQLKAKLAASKEQPVIPAAIAAGDRKR